MQVPTIAQIAPPPPSNIDARVSDLSEQIVCNCGCGNKIVDKCYCGVADQFRAEIRSQVGAGSTDTQILARFVQRYGEEILASPVPEGFNLTAWATPLTALLLGIALVTFLMRKWRRSSSVEATPPPKPAPATVDPYEEAFEAEYASRRD